MIEATEFPQLSMQYNVRGVPRTIVDGRMSIEGNVPESEFVGRIIRGFKENFQ
jgi:predicted DsbA family dithiol-disulfide isomerase